MFNKTINQTIVISIIYFATLVLVTFLAWNYVTPENREMDTIFAVISIIPIVFYLILSGKIVGFKGGGIELMLKNEAEKSAPTQFEDKQIEFQEERLQQKSSTSLLDTFKNDPPTTLVLNIGRTGYYAESAILRYMGELSQYSQFKYILFTDSNHRFLGYMHVDDFKDLLKSEQNNIVSLIETGEVLNKPKVFKESVQKGVTNKQVLSKMDSLNLEELAILDDSYHFLGTIKQSDIVRKVLSNVIKEA